MHTKLARLAVLMLGLISTVCAASASAQNGPPPGPYEAKLDGLLAARNFDGLSRAVFSEVKDADTAGRALHWLYLKSLGGGSTLIASLYSASQWRLGNSVPEPRKAQIHGSAGAHLILARWLIQTEGFQCADTSAPSARLAFVDSQLAEVGQYLSALPAYPKRRALDEAFTTMMRTFSSRENDVWLCSGGMAHFGKYFEKHPNEKGKEVSVPGTVGKTVVLPADPSILPGFVPYRDWKARRQAAVDKIADELRIKLTIEGDQPTRMR